MAQNLNAPAISDGPVTVADLEVAREESAAYWLKFLQQPEVAPWYDAVPDAQPEAAHAACKQDDPPLAQFSEWSPAVNLVLIVMAFALAAALDALNKPKASVVVMLAVALPLVLVFVAHTFARWRG